MQAKARLLGHPIHQMLIVFPLGLLGMATIFDIIASAVNKPVLFTSACWMMGAGVISALIAAVFGAIDWWAIPAGTRAKTIGLVHGIIMVTTVLLYAISFFLRFQHAAEPGSPAVAFSVAGVMLALVGGWFGGELVDRYGIGVNDNANVNPPGAIMR